MLSEAVVVIDITGVVLAHTSSFIFTVVSVQCDLSYRSEGAEGVIKCIPVVGKR